MIHPFWSSIEYTYLFIAITPRSTRNQSSSKRKGCIYCLSLLMFENYKYPIGIRGSNSHKKIELWMVYGSAWKHLTEGVSVA